MDRRLYEMSEDLEAIGAALAENGGELTPELEAALDAIGAEFDAKVERIALFALDTEALADAAAAESKRLAELAKSRANVAERLRRYLLDQMQRADRAKVDTARCRVWWQRNGKPRVTLPADARTLVPLGFAREEQRVDVLVDRDAIAAAWDDVEQRSALEGAGVSVERGCSLRIK